MASVDCRGAHSSNVAGGALARRSGGGVDAKHGAIVEVELRGGAVPADLGDGAPLDDRRELLVPGHTSARHGTGGSACRCTGGARCSRRWRLRLFLRALAEGGFGCTYIR